MIQTTLADASPAAGEVVALIDELRAEVWSDGDMIAGPTDLDRRAANALDAFRAETDAMRAERDEAKADAFRLAANQCDGPMVGDDWGHYYCAKTTALEAEVSDLKAKLARIIQAHDENSGAEPSVSVFEREIESARTTLAAIGETKP